MTNEPNDYDDFATQIQSDELIPAHELEDADPDDFGWEYDDEAYGDDAEIVILCHDDDGYYSDFPF